MDILPIFSWAAVFSGACVDIKRPVAYGPLLIAYRSLSRTLAK